MKHSPYYMLVINLIFTKSYEKVEAILTQHNPPQSQISTEKTSQLEIILNDAKEHPDRFSL